MHKVVRGEGKKGSERHRTRVILRENISNGNFPILQQVPHNALLYKMSSSHVEKEFRSELVAEFVIQINRKTRKLSAIAFSPKRRAVVG